MNQIRTDLSVVAIGLIGICAIIALRLARIDTAITTLTGQADLNSACITQVQHIELRRILTDPTCSEDTRAFIMDTVRGLADAGDFIDEMEWLYKQNIGRDKDRPWPNIEVSPDSQPWWVPRVEVVPNTLTRRSKDESIWSF